MSTCRVDLEEGDRQLVLMALAHLSLERPGWDYALNLIAMKMDNIDRAQGAEPAREPRAKLYDTFRELKR